MQIKSEEISKIIKEQIKNYNNKIKEDDIGYVISVGDGIARVHGIEDCMSNELLLFPGDVYGMALNWKKDLFPQCCSVTMRVFWKAML